MEVCQLTLVNLRVKQFGEPGGTSRIASRPAQPAPIWIDSGEYNSPLQAEFHDAVTALGKRQEVCHRTPSRTPKSGLPYSAKTGGLGTTLLPEKATSRGPYPCISKTTLARSPAGRCYAARDCPKDHRKVPLQANNRPCGKQAIAGLRGCRNIATRE